MSDILDQLRYREREDVRNTPSGSICGEAADEIERLRAENARLLDALETTFTYGLPPHDISGQTAWQEAGSTFREIRKKNDYLPPKSE